jgi:hypothetical protein
MWMALSSRSWPPGHPSDDQSPFIMKLCLINCVAMLCAACLGDKLVSFLPALMCAVV